jgi:hypothetical protein
MKMFVAVIALAMAATAPAFAPGQQAQAQTYSSDQATPHKAKVKKSKTQKRVVQRVVRSASPYSTNPAHDAYVNGVYVGSDPDPRIRWSLKREYCQDSLDGCGY